MGSIVTMKCGECGYEQEHFLGAGMMDYQDFGRNRTKRDILRGVYGEEVRKALEKNPKANVYRSNDLFYCECCGMHTSKSSVRLFKTKKFLWRRKSVLLISSVHVCERCQKEMIRIEENKCSGLSCPQCKAPLKIFSGGCWD
ncbi:MAG: hypothetical protein J6B09_00600 [Clostridia bacterium]|nr:hypothetical protein [Clostridia bacterium]